MKQIQRFLLVLMTMCYLSSASQAGIRGNGEYCGVAVFDRWGGCTLYSGIYVMYVSEQVKQGLLPYKGQNVRIDAMEVEQPMNPGDGLIKKFTYLGAPPVDDVQEIKLRTFSDFRNGEKPCVVIEVLNVGEKAKVIRSSELAPTLLAQREADSRFYAPSNGPSFALVTRQGFWNGSPTPSNLPIGHGADQARWRNANGIGEPYWTIGKENALPYEFTLEPKQKRLIKMIFSLPSGQYDFLCGYGGGVHQYQCVASNLTAFDVGNDGKGIIVDAKKLRR